LQGFGDEVHLVPAVASLIFQVDPLLHPFVQLRLLLQSPQPFDLFAVVVLREEDI
jgi:hypothetical protein